jgi:phosphoribosyl 1,2-cyclic phosphodiesterase
VRGSIPSPGPATARYGGNTSCVAIDFAPGKTLILDAGTGIRPLGDLLAPTDTRIFVATTHDHWDHIQGFPFFKPIFQADRRIDLIMPDRGRAAFCSLIAQMDGFHFPIPGDALLSKHKVHSGDPAALFAAHGLEVRTIPTNHPGGAVGFRIAAGGRSVVYIPDNELEPPGKPVTTFGQFADFCREADVLIHDAMYTEAEMPTKIGWGHSSQEQCCRLALAASPRTLVLFHHDPGRTDTELDAIQHACRTRLARDGSSTRCLAGSEGLTFELAAASAPSRRAAG